MMCRAPGRPANVGSLIAASMLTTEPGRLLLGRRGNWKHCGLQLEYCRGGQGCIASDAVFPLLAQSLQIIFLFTASPLCIFCSLSFVHGRLARSPASGSADKWVASRWVRQPATGTADRGPGGMESLIGSKKDGLDKGGLEKVFW